MLRRDLLKALMALAAAPSVALADEVGLTLGEGALFTHEALIERARALATAPYTPHVPVPQEWLDLTYDQFRSIWFDARNAMWEKSDLPLRLDLFAAGLYFERAVDLYVVDGGMARQIAFDIRVFDRTDTFPITHDGPGTGYSGFRMRAETEKPEVFQEFAVFQGASYFRAIGKGQIYGLSARGLAIATAEPEGEEFPDFTAMYIETPLPGKSEFVVHALLDSPSCAGAYRFVIKPGIATVMDVEARLFARTDIRRIGLGPLTSMFLFDETNRERFSDFRPKVHDSDGLMILNGRGETIWRPLANPRVLQVSAFSDNGPKGFGLMQRSRKFSDFADIEALYHLRPSLWVEPAGDWGRGSVVLVEIPSDQEIYDNIVAFWRPDVPLVAGQDMALNYRLNWGDEPVLPDTSLRVINTQIGARREGGFIIAIDFENGAAVPEDLGLIEITAHASSGTVSHPVLQRNPETEGPRLAFTLLPGEAGLVELRAELRLGGAALSEVWLYRWTA